MKNVLFAGLFFMQFIPAAQCPDDGYIDLRYQAEIDQFFLDYLHCKAILALYIYLSDGVITSVRFIKSN